MFQKARSKPTQHAPMSMTPKQEEKLDKLCEQMSNVHTKCSVLEVKMDNVCRDHTALKTDVESLKQSRSHYLGVAAGVSLIVGVVVAVIKALI